MIRLPLLLLLAILTGSPAKAQIDPVTVARERIRAVIVTHDLPSVSVAVGRGGKLVWAEALGVADRRSGRAATADTPYAIASITKPITAVAILMLAERGQLDLDAPINDYLGEPKLVAKVGDAQEATVRRVLQHRAGLPLHFHLIYDEDGTASGDLDEAIRLFGTIVSNPGETRQYSNFGYGILGRVIARVSGRSYERFVAEEIFAPLKMTQSFVATTSHLPSAAALHLKSGARAPFADTDHRAAAAVYASAPDLVRFGHFLIAASKGKSSLLSKASLAEMIAPDEVSQASEEHYGLGLAVWNHHGARVWHQSGSMPGASAQLLIGPEEDLVVAVLSNESGAPDWTILNHVLSVFAPKLDRSGEPLEALPDLVGEWQGHVALPNGGEVSTAICFDADGGLKLAFGGASARPLRTRNLEDGFIELSAIGLDPRSEAVERPFVELRFKLKPRGEALNGSVAIIPLTRSARGTSALSYWTTLSPDPDFRPKPCRASIAGRDD